MQWRDSFHAGIDDSNGSSCFSYVGDMNAYLNIDNRNKTIYPSTPAKQMNS